MYYLGDPAYDTKNLSGHRILNERKMSFKQTLFVLQLASQ